MHGPREILEVSLDEYTSARIEIQILSQPTIPTPQEPATLTVPTARQLEATARLLCARKHHFPPVK